MDVEPAQESLFNEVYDQEHVPKLKEVPGLISAARFKRVELTMIVGGERTQISLQHEPMYNAIYEIENPEVLVSDAWAKAVEWGRRPKEVRPHTRNRRHVLYRRLLP
jgi:hypothetical protein